MSELTPAAQQHPSPASGITMGGEPVTGKVSQDAAPIEYSTLTSPSARAGQSAFQSGFAPIPEDPANTGGPA
jgi:hypothetical protein